MQRRKINHDNEALIRTLIREYTYGFNIDTKFTKIFGGAKSEGLIKTAMDWIRNALEIGGIFAILKAVTWLLNKPKDMSYVEYAFLSYEELKTSVLGKAAEAVHKIVTATTEDAKSAVIKSIQRDAAYAQYAPYIPAPIKAMITPPVPSGAKKEARTYKGSGLTLLFEAEAEKIRFPKIGNSILYSAKIGNYVESLESNFLPQMIDTSSDLSIIKRKIKNNDQIEDAVKVGLQKFIVTYDKLKSAKTASGSYPNNFSNIIKAPPIGDFNDLLSEPNQQELARQCLTNAFLEKGISTWRSEILAFVGECINAIDSSTLEDDDKRDLKLNVAEALVDTIGTSVLTSITDFFTSNQQVLDMF